MSTNGNNKNGSVGLHNPLDESPEQTSSQGPTRIQVKLETQVSSAVQAPVVAEVEYTYAIGDRIIVPAGARVYGQLQQADRSGFVSIIFDEIELLDGAREKIDAVGTGLDLGPIKGSVYGKNTGKNFLVRAASGLGSVLAEVAGNNTSAAFSEDDMLRERLSENIGTAGDSEVMSLDANSRVVVSVPADTRPTFTKHEGAPPSFTRSAPRFNRLLTRRTDSLHRPGLSARAFMHAAIVFTGLAAVTRPPGSCFQSCAAEVPFLLRNPLLRYGSVRMSQSANWEMFAPDAPV
jgi:hypothetical protein